ATTATYRVFNASAALGVSVAVIELPSYATLAATGVVVPAAVSVKLEAVIVLASIAPEKAAVMEGVAEMPVAASGGLHAVTLGADPAVAAGSAIAVVTAMTISAMSVRRFTPSPRLPLSRLPSRATR